MALELTQALARLRVPHSHRIVAAAAHDARAVSAQCHRVTVSLWPSSVRKHSPDCASHTRTVLSSLPLTMRVPSPLNATDLTKLLWPSSVRKHSPDGGASHTREVYCTWLHSSVSLRASSHVAST